MQSSFLESRRESEIRHLQAKKRDLLIELARANKELSSLQDDTKRMRISFPEAAESVYLTRAVDGVFTIEVYKNRPAGVSSREIHPLDWQSMVAAVSTLMSREVDHFGT